MATGHTTPNDCLGRQLGWLTPQVRAVGPREQPGAAGGLQPYLRRSAPVPPPHGIIPPIERDQAPRRDLAHHRILRQPGAKPPLLPQARLLRASRDATGMRQSRHQAAAAVGRSGASLALRAVPRLAVPLPLGDRVAPWRVGPTPSVYCPLLTTATA